MTGRHWRVRLGAALAALSLVASCSSGDDVPNDEVPDADAPRTDVDDELSGDGATGAASELSALELRPLTVRDGRIADDLGRSVLLRGANVNALGDYHQADPSIDPTAPVTDDDWAMMAAHGFSVVRLIISWSAVEPARGEIDEAYLARVRDAVDAANAHGIYVVLDMHQDAWAKYVATPDDEECAEGDAAIGWDGAPEWATITDGASTCRDGGRESAPAVKAAFGNFYRNTDGIRDALASTWGMIAGAFAGRPGIAGYELLNEPNQADGSDEEIAGYGRFVSDSIDAIRAAEREAGTDPALIFVEPLVLFPLPNTQLDGTLLDDPLVVFAPHNYAESIGPKILSVEQTMQVDVEEGSRLGAARASGSPWPVWIGEYGYWDTSEATLSVARRFAVAEDDAAIGSAWWQWRQTCGDPHAVGSPGATATEDQVQLITRACPADVDVGPTEAFLEIAGRAYPRLTPGRIDALSSDPVTGEFSLVGRAGDDRGELVVWVPARDRDEPPTPTVEGLDEVAFTAVEGGWYLTADVASQRYSIAYG